jgi:hypothetical protein
VCLALTGVAESIHGHFDVRTNVCGICLDVQKASDSVSHDILLHKMYFFMALKVLFVMV